MKVLQLRFVLELVLMVVLLAVVVGRVRSLAVDEETYWPSMSSEDMEKLEIVSSKLDEHQMNASFREVDDFKSIKATNNTATSPPPQKWPQWLIDRLKNTNPLNIDEVIDGS